VCSSLGLFKFSSNLPTIKKFTLLMERERERERELDRMERERDCFNV